MKFKNRTFYQNFSYAFLPWAIFWNESGPNILDQTLLQVGISSSSDCRIMLNTFRGKVLTTDASRSRGLGFRREPMSTEEAMIFLFPSDQQLTFWMKNTYIPLEILYFNSQGTKIGGNEMGVEKDPNIPSVIYSPSSHGQVALEIKAGSISLQSGQLFLCADKKT